MFRNHCVAQAQKCNNARKVLPVQYRPGAKKIWKFLIKLQSETELTEKN